MNNKLNILRCGDQNFWAYYWIAQEHKRYTQHNIEYAKHDEVNLENKDIVYIHSPDITHYHADTLPMEAKNKGIKVIGAYAGNPEYWSPAEKRTYSYADIIVTISPQTYSFAKFHYTNIPTIYMPECIDDNFFTPKTFDKDSFVIGWAGGIHKKIKRFYLTERLNYNISLKDDWKKQRHTKEKNLTLKQMAEYYKSIDVLIVTSQSECQPRVVMEAMATGIPVIATDVGSMRMLLDDFCVVEPYNESLLINQMNEKLRILKKYPQFRKELGEKNREYISKYFSWKNTQKLWDNLFKYITTNDYNKIREISTLYLEALPNKKAFYDIYQKDFDQKQKISRQNLTLKQQFLLIDELFENANINYCLRQTSFLDAINYRKPKTTVKDLYISTDNLEKAKKIIQDLNLELNIHFIDNFPKQTKKTKFFGKLINVPHPVKDYLSELS